MKPNLILILYLCSPIVLFGQVNETKCYNTVKVESDPPLIDGILNDTAWDLVGWGSDFVQRTPVDGATPSQETRFKILYDDKYLYVGVQALDSFPDKIVRRMSRRDGFEGDFVEVNIDSYADKRTAFSFSASASGVKGEEYVTNNGENWDSTWDPIWYLKTSLNGKGWIAEFKIPLSQLRFPDRKEHVWGIQVMRKFFRNNERSYWQPIPQDAPGWVHLFGELRGIKGIRPQKQLEVQPYMVAKTERSPREPGNPYATGSFHDIDVGVDAKVGITSNVTLDITLNPDFGQVEADPSQVNLSAFQLFFRERRPFFLEGNNILNFPLTQSVAGGAFNNDNLFYSRRIGSKPSYSPETDDIAYVSRIENTTILGAAKVTGKNRNGFSWGILESVTDSEKVEVQDTTGLKRDVYTEPMTNYLVGRVQQDINEGNAILGAMFTSTNRFINHSQFDFLHDNAYSGGIDFTQNFNNRRYYVSFNGALSHVQGSTNAIYETQTSPERFFQRPDNQHKQPDSTRSSLTGSSATAAFGKKDGNLIFQTGATFRSPEFEVNDVGFLVQSDYISQWTWAQYRILKPFSVFRSLRSNINQWLTWDFDGINLYKAVNTNSHFQFNNLWYFGTGITCVGENVSNADLRGGPAIKYPGYVEFWVYLSSNERKKLAFELNPWIVRAQRNFYRETGTSLDVRFQPTDALRILLSPSVSFTTNSLQYVDSYEVDGGGNRYVLGKVRQVTYRASARLNYIITPNLSVEYWGQPFISTGEYSDFMRVLDASSSQMENRYRPFDLEAITRKVENDVFEIDEDRNGVAEHQLDDPNFNYLQFRSNFVIRWEYVPGSTLFLVWTTNSSDSHNSSVNDFRDLASDLYRVEATNIFLLKYTYRFIL